MSLSLLVIVGGCIVICLACYAGYLLLQLKKQKEEQQKLHEQAIEKRNANIFEHVSTLSLVGIQGQCDLSEICIRVYCIMEYLQGPQRIKLENAYPSIVELYNVVKDMPRGEERSKLPKKTRMEQNLVRMKAETRLSAAIIEELKDLHQQVQSSNN
ncbi:DUF2489 domain-containing protein [Vibrio sp. RC27]